MLFSTSTPAQLKRLSAFALLAAGSASVVAGPAFKPAEFDAIFDGMYGAAPALKRGEIAATMLLVAKEDCTSNTRLKRLGEDKILPAMLGNVDVRAVSANESAERALRDSLVRLYREQSARVNCMWSAEEQAWLIEETATLGEEHLLRGQEAFKRLRAIRQAEAAQEALARPPKRNIEQDPKAWHRHYFPDYGHLSASADAIRLRAFGFVRSGGMQEREGLASAFAAAKCKGRGTASERVSAKELAQPEDAFDVDYAYACVQESAAQGRKRQPAAQVSYPPTRLDVNAAVARGARFSGQLAEDGSYTAVIKFSTVSREAAADLVQLALHDSLVSGSEGCKSGRAALRTVEFWLLAKDPKNDAALKVSLTCESGKAP
jgi:hypothetical protein